MSTATRVLFDEPGPRGRRAIRLWSVAIALVSAALLGLAIFEFWDHDQLDPARWQAFGEPVIQNFLFDGIKGTFLATMVAALFAFPLGLLLALARHSGGLLGLLAAAWIEFFRSMPMLLVVYAFLLALPRYGIIAPIFWMLVIPMVLVSSASTAEVFRAGIRAVNKGQGEAAAALGMSSWLAMRLVVLPQALRLVTPNLLTQLVSLLKDSTLGYVVSYPELMQQGRALTTYTHYMVQTYLVVAVIYVLVNLALTQLANHLQRRVQRRAAPARPVPETVTMEITPVQG